MIARIVASSAPGDTAGPSALLHFTEEEWRVATAGIVTVTDLDDQDVRLLAAPMPDPNGGMLVALKCPIGCLPNHDFGKIALDHHRWSECHCEERADIRLLPTGRCKLAYPVAFEGPFACQSESCTGECVLGLTEGAAGVTKLACLCR